MKVATRSYYDKQFVNIEANDNPDNNKVQLILGFGAKTLLATDTLYDKLHKQYPQAEIVLCSTSGEIVNDKVIDNSVSVTAIEFEKSYIQAVVVNIDDYSNSFNAGFALVEKFEITDDLSCIMIFSDGGKVNGSELVNGINARIQNKVPVTGGLAGDGTDFNATLVGLNQEPQPGNIVAVAFYGNDIKVTHGSMGGWEVFGPERTVTRSTANQLFEINHENALEVYKKYLGAYADDLPGSALLFPLSVKLSTANEPVVRTILSIDSEKKAMVFAGDVPEGSQVRFMKANFDKLIDAASEAAHQTLNTEMPGSPKLAILVSCVGRKMILDSRTEEEVESVREVYGENTFITGFYSYGEISPLSAKTECQLHNQTMTITTFNEI